MTYKRMSAEERRLIYKWRREGCGVRKISKLLGRCVSSVCTKTRNFASFLGHDHFLK